MVRRARPSIGSPESSIEEFDFDQPGEAVAVDEKDVSGIGRSGLYATTGAEDVSHGLFRHGVVLGSLIVIVGYTYECTASQKEISGNT